MKKIAFFDIDGTLVSFHTHRVSERKPDVFKYRKMYPERGATLSGSRL